MTDVVTPISARILNDTGKNRGIGFNALGANNDAEAVRLFLMQYSSEGTLRAYRREVYRLVAWATYVPRKSLTDLTAQDFAQYADFLTNLPSTWCGKELVVFGESVKLFFSSLSKTSLHHAFAIIKSFVTFLVQHNYLHTYPLFKNTIAVRPSNEVQRRRRQERQLVAAQHQALYRWFDENQDSFDSIRVRFCVSLMLFMGLRIHEVVLHKMNDFVQSDGAWIFQVLGKGNKYEELAVPTRLLEELIRFRTFLKLSPLPGRQDDQPLLPSSNGRAIGERRVSQIVKDAVSQAANFLPDGESKNEMKKCSSHWFRHMFCFNMARSGMALQDIQKMARHAKIETTFLYIDSIREHRHAAMQDFRYDVLETNEPLEA